jgi:tetratricopeptide (TPR) repeat protein
MNAYIASHRIVSRLFLAGMITFSGWGMNEVVGQQLADSVSYDPGINLIRTAKTTKEYTAAASYFENLAIQKPDQWLALYYTAFCYIQASYPAEPDKTKDALLDKAQPWIDKAFHLKPDEPELYVLQAFLYQSRIQINPALRGMSYSMKADSELRTATGKDDGNPRAWSLLGYNLYHTPAAFGGGPQKALPLFLKAREKYRSFKPSLPFMPNWGEPENQNMIAICEKSAK